MLRLQGNWFDGKLSQKTSARMEVTSTDIRVYRESDQLVIHQANLHQVEVSSRIGHTPRYVRWPTGEQFETTDNDAVDHLMRLQSPSGVRSLAHRLESHLGFVVLTVMLVAIISWAGGKYGLPAAAQTMAFALPQSSLDRAATETLIFLDKFEFAPSKLSAEERAGLLKHFDAAIQENRHLNITVEFRDGQDIGANAFALPNGTIIFTDQIIALADHYDELLAVLAHEIGHVEHRHSLRSVIQASALSVAVTLLVGDASAMGDVLVNLPIMMSTAAYSRDFEREADDHSLAFLDKHAIPRHRFIDLMEKLSGDHQCRVLFNLKQANIRPDDVKQDNAKPANTATENKSTALRDEPAAADYDTLTKAERKRLCAELAGEAASSPSANALDSALDYFSSHPDTDERLEKFRQSPHRVDAQ